MTRIARTKNAGDAWGNTIPGTSEEILALYGVTEEWDDSQAGIFGQNVRLGDVVIAVENASEGYSVRDLRGTSSYDVISPETMRTAIQWFVDNGQFSLGIPSAGIWTLTAANIAAMKADIPELHDGNGNGVPGLPAWAEEVLPS